MGGPKMRQPNFLRMAEMSSLWLEATSLNRPSTFPGENMMSNQRGTPERLHQA